MSKQPPPQAEPRAEPPAEPRAEAWKWGSTPRTRRGLVDAARAGFTEQGYSPARIPDVGKRGGSSVGGPFPPLGGKSDPFPAPNGKASDRGKGEISVGGRF